MTAPAKFLFDTDFGRADSFARHGKAAAAARETVLAQARQDGFDEGQRCGRREAALEIEGQTLRVLERLAASLGSLAGEFDALERRLEAEAVEVAFAIARKLAPALIAREPFAEVAALVAECFKSLVTAPHVVIRVNDAVYESAKSQFDELAAAAGFTGRLIVLAESEIAAGDCRIEWADGGMVRDRSLVEAAVAEAVSRYVTGRRVRPTFAEESHHVRP